MSGSEDGVLLRVLMPLCAGLPRQPPLRWAATPSHSEGEFQKA